MFSEFRGERRVTVLAPSSRVFRKDLTMTPDRRPAIHILGRPVSYVVPLGVLLAAAAARLHAHFRRRELYETRQFRALSRADLTALRTQRRQFAGEAYDADFAAW